MERLRCGWGRRLCVVPPAFMCWCLWIPQGPTDPQPPSCHRHTFTQRQTFTLLDLSLLRPHAPLFSDPQPHQPLCSWSLTLSHGFFQLGRSSCPYQGSHRTLALTPDLGCHTLFHPPTQHNSSHTHTSLPSGLGVDHRGEDNASPLQPLCMPACKSPAKSEMPIIVMIVSHTY